MPSALAEESRPGVLINRDHGRGVENVARAAGQLCGDLERCRQNVVHGRKYRPQLESFLAEISVAERRDDHEVVVRLVVMHDQGEGTGEGPERRLAQRRWRWSVHRRGSSPA